jgi:hypothetical protein
MAADLMEELLVKALKSAPPWVMRVLIAAALVGAALNQACVLFSPLISAKLADVIDPAKMDYTAWTFASLCIVGPAFFVAHILSPSRSLVTQVNGRIATVEAAMQQVNLNDRERVTIRRAMIKALADAAHRDIGGPMNADLESAANEESPGLIKNAK